MTIIDRDMLWDQFGAAIDMLGDALRDCPDELWEARLWGDQPGLWAPVTFSQFWYLGFHALFWLDLYLTGAEEGFAPPAPFDLAELDPNGVPPRTYSRAELLAYLDYCRNKCRQTVETLTGERASELCSFPNRKLPYAELQLYNMRHVQEHEAQLHLFLGQQAGQSAKWVARAR